MSCNSLTSPLSFTNSGNGDNDNRNQNFPLRDSTQSLSPYTVGGSGGDNTCNPASKKESSYAKAAKFGMECSSYPSYPPTSPRTLPALSSSNPLLDKEIDNPESPDLRAHENPCFGPSTPPVDHMEELFALCLLGKVWEEYVPFPATINKTKSDWKFIRGQVSYVDLGNDWVSFKFANVEDKERV